MLIAPKGTPPGVIAALNDAFSAALVQADTRSKMLTMDLGFVSNTQEQAALRLRREADKWACIVERLGLKVDGPT